MELKAILLTGYSAGVQPLTMPQISDQLACEQQVYRAAAAKVQHSCINIAQNISS